ARSDRRSGRDAHGHDHAWCDVSAGLVAFAELTVVVPSPTAHGAAHAQRAGVVGACADGAGGLAERDGSEGGICDRAWGCCAGHDPQLTESIVAPTDDAAVFEQSAAVVEPGADVRDRAAGAEGNDIERVASLRAASATAGKPKLSEAVVTPANGDVALRISFGDDRAAVAAAR